MNMQVQLATTDADINRCLPIMSQLRPYLKRETFVARVHRQQQRGYQLVYLEADGQIRTIAGFRIEENLAHGLHLYVDDLVTDAETRSRGCGAFMLDWLAEHARQHRCTMLDLDSGVQRSLAHRFYFSHGMQITSYHFRMGLLQND